MTESCRIYSLGRHSNIPQCCVLFFLAHWGSIIHINHVRDSLLGIAMRFGYVPCTECLLKDSQISVHLCAGKPCDSFYRWED